VSADSTDKAAEAGGVTDGELLRLARKAWPGSRPHLLNVHEMLMCDSTSGAIRVGANDNNPRHRAAIHAALLVLAGEVDLQAVLDAAEGARRE
jgi:hypothetical protein